jgi:hypothetical protein
MDDQGQQEQAMSSEQAADWARLQADAVGQENDAEAAMQAQEQEQQATLHDENQQAMATLLEFAVPAFVVMGYPSVEGALNHDARQRLAGAWAAVATKRGYSLASFGFAYKEELAAVFVTYQVGSAVVAAIRSDAEERRKAEQEEKEKNKVTEPVRVADE